MVRENVKKKRKSNSADNDGDVDIYKKLCDFEEKEASSTKYSENEDVFFKICEEIREVLAEANERKHNLDGEIFENKMEYISEVAVKICLIKKLNRVEKLSHVFGKEVLNNEKQKCDSIKLAFQNLVYELHHLVSETNKCLSFKSDDENIDLVTLQEFMQIAPESVTSNFKKIDKNNADQEHALRLARLEFELTQRKNTAVECKTMEEHKKNMISEITERKEKLNSLITLLGNVLKAVKPLQEHLGMDMEQTRKEHKLAKLLCEPLYILYANIVAYKSVYATNITVSIKGDKDEAIQWKEAQEISNSNDVNMDDSEQEFDLPEVEEVVEVKKRRHRKSVQQVDPLEEKKKKLLEVHPLKVEATFAMKDGLNLTITFSYYTKLKIVTVTSKVSVPSKITAKTAVEILLGDNIMNELIDNDNGLESPSPNTIYHLQKIDLGSFQSLVPEIGYAYRWAQKICGIDFISPKKFIEELSQQNIEIVMKTIQKRLLTRANLAQQMEQLEQNILPAIPSSVESPSNPTSSLSKWVSISYQEFCQFEYTKSLVDEDIAATTDMFYSANITRNSANLRALIVIKNSYPIPAPIFALSLDYKGKHNSSNSDDIRDLERVLNIDWNYGMQSSSWLLAAQLMYLCSCLDVYLESLDAALPQNAKFIRSVCGRNRRRPFKFRKVGTGIFTQY